MVWAWLIVVNSSLFNTSQIVSLCKWFWVMMSFCTFNATLVDYSSMYKYMDAINIRWNIKVWVFFLEWSLHFLLQKHIHFILLYFQSTAVHRCLNCWTSGWNHFRNVSHTVYNVIPLQTWEIYCWRDWDLNMTSAAYSFFN